MSQCGDLFVSRNDDMLVWLHITSKIVTKLVDIDF